MAAAMSGEYLLEHPNPHGDHFYRTRRGTVLAIVVHITAGLEDLDGLDDQSAEKTARYAATTDRKVSWHSGSDSDSSLDLLPASFTAWHCGGYNTRTYGHEISKAHPDWRDSNPAWAMRTLWFAARHLAPKARALGVPLRQATRDELDQAIARNGQPVGFIGHAPLDPARRRDPGLVGQTDTFPWTAFLSLVHQFSTPAPPPPPPATTTRVYASQEDGTMLHHLEASFDRGEIDHQGRAQIFTDFAYDKTCPPGAAVPVRPYADGYYPGERPGTAPVAAKSNDGGKTLIVVTGCPTGPGATVEVAVEVKP